MRLRVRVDSLIKLSKQKKLESKETTVCLITGNGLKTPDVIAKNVKTIDIDMNEKNLEHILATSN